MRIGKQSCRAALVAAGIMASMTGIGCGRNAADSSTPAEAAVLISAKDVVVAGVHRLEAGVTFTGELVPVEIVELTARIDGDLENIRVRDGDPVRRGQALARYRPRDVEDRLRAAEAQLLAAQAGLRAAENGARRVQRLFEAGAASASDLDAAQAQHAAAQAASDNALATRNIAQEDAERLDVPSPIEGWVSRVHVHAGDHTAAGDPLFTLVNTTTLELSATVPSETLGRVRPGTPMRFRIAAFPEEEFTGQVDRINPTTEPGTRQVRIYMRLPNPEGRLVGGLFASGRVVDAVREEAVGAALSVLRREGSEQVVYRLHGGRAERTPVRTGLVDDEAGIVELVGTIAAGDSLLTGVLPGLRDGVPVKVLAAAGSSGGAPVGER
ncbi:MAG: efflux RND transporter periplasmic adaptor subunit [Candidatus Eisenbacteria bacterium]